MTDYEDVEILGEDQAGELSEDDPVDRAVFIALDEAAGKLDSQGEFEPFLIIVEGEEIHIEQQDGDDEATILESARATIFQMKLLADAYILTYDGFVELDEGQSDAIIVEYARKGDTEATVLGWLYYEHDDHLHFQEPLYSLGSAPSLYDEVASAAVVDADDDASV